MLDVSLVKKIRFLELFMAIGAVVLLSSGCTRATDANNAVVTVAIPSSKNVSNKLETIQSSEIPQHIVVKISGSGMSPVNYIWDGHNGTSGGAPSISLSVPQGLGRLIQVLYVTQDSTQTLYFYYNDVTQDFTTANVSIAITVNSLSSSTSQGQIIGKYLDASGVGPTGVLSTVFQPPNGKPAMTVDTNEMFGGWFKAFALPTQAFTYVLDDGRILLKDLVVSAAAVTGQYSTLITQPAGFRKFSGGGSYDPTNAQSILAGFFGPGATTVSRNICMNPSGGNIANLYTDTAATPMSYASSSCTNNQVCRSVGGDTTDYFSAVCANPDNINYVRFSENQLANRDSVMLFKGPFAVIPNTNGVSEMAGRLIGNSLSLGWTFMPGAAASLDGVEVFYKVENSIAGSNSDPVYKNNQGYDCSNLVAKYGFISAGQIPVAQTVLSGFNVGPVAPSQSLTAIACPLIRSRNPIYYNSAARWVNTNNQGPGPSISRILTNGNVIYYNNCQPVMVGLYDGANSATPAQSPVSLVISSNNGLLNFYANNDCSDAGTTSTSIIFNQGETSKLLYYKMSSGGSAILNVAANGMVTAASPVTVNGTTGSPGGTPNGYGVLEPQFAIVGNCHPYLFETLSSTANIGAVAPPSALSLSTIIAPGGIPLFTDPDCIFLVTASTTISTTAVILYGRASYPASSQVVGGTIGGLSKVYYNNTTNITN